MALSSISSPEQIQADQQKYAIPAASATPSDPSIPSPSDYMASVDSGKPIPKSQPDIQTNADEANKFLNKSAVGQIFTPEFLKQVPQATYDVLVKNALKFVHSAANVPQNIVQSLEGKDITDTPGVGFEGEPITSFQSDFQNQTLPAVESGQETPLGATAKTVGGVVSGGADVLGAAGIAEGGIKALKNTGTTLKDILSYTGDTPGGGGGGTGYESPDELSKMQNNSEDTLKSRIKDATPDYNKNMTSQNIRLPDSVDENGNVTKGRIVPRLSEESSGIIGERIPVSSASDHAAGTELNDIKNYPANGTALQKSLSAKLALSDEAESMRGGLQKEDSENPLDASSEINKEENLVKSNLPKDIQDQIGYLSKENPLTKLGVKDVPQSDLSKALQEMQGEETKLPKNASGRYYQKVLDALKNYDGSREGKLDLRQAVDDAFDSQNGKYAHGTPAQSELLETHTDIRNSLNKDLADTTENSDTQSSLKKQSNLYHAIDILNDKAASEAPSALGRFLEKNPIVRQISRMVLRRAIGQVL